MVSFDVKVLGADTSKYISKAIERKTRMKLIDASIHMKDKAEEKMAKLFDLNRPAIRRRHPGSGRAKGSIGTTVEGSTFPFVLQYRITGGDLVVKRVAGLNFGTGAPREIVPNGNWSFRGSTPVEPKKFSRNVPPHLAWKEGGKWEIHDKVWHPGTDATNFLEEARDEAAAKFLQW